MSFYPQPGRPPKAVPLLPVADILREELLTERQRRRHLRVGPHFRDFARYFWPWYVPTTPQPTWLWFHDAICDEIEDLFAEADRRRAIVEEVNRIQLPAEDRAVLIRQRIAGGGEIPRLDLVVEIGPRSAKSSLIQRALPAWRWRDRPREQFLTLACSDRLVERDGIYLRDLIQGPEYQAFLRNVGAPKWGLRQDQNAKSKFDTTVGGTRQGYSIESRFTGADSDCTIIDDPHDLEDLMNRPPESIARAADQVVATYRDKVQDRANNPLFHVTILIMQRVAENDLAAYMLSRGARSVCLPTLYDPDHPRRYHRDPRTRRDEPLDPIRKPLAEMEARRKESAWWFESKEQQNPQPQTGQGLTRENFATRYNGDPVALAKTCDEVWISSDSAQKGGDANDYHGIHVYGLKGARRFVLDYKTDHFGPAEYDLCMDGLVEQWLPVCRAAGISLCVLAEDTANAAHWLATRLHRWPKTVHLHPFRPNDTPGKDKGKPARWHYFVRDATAGQIILPERAPWAETLLSRLLAGLRAAHDDDADTASQLSVFLETRDQTTPAVDQFSFLLRPGMR